MKIYISADIEGIAALADWNEATLSHAEAAPFMKQMTQEVAAACEGAIAAGASDIWVKDAHDTARNLDFGDLPEQVKLIRGWSQHPFCMMQGLDSSFAAALLLGYHSRAGSGGNPLAHTMNPDLAWLKINNIPASEFLINAYTAAYAGVPVVFVSGDEQICRDAESLIPDIVTVATKTGVGNSVICHHPRLIVNQIRDAVTSALAPRITVPVPELPPRFKVEICYTKLANAYKTSFYPGATLASPSTVVFETDCY